METMDEMKARHAREKLELIQCLAPNFALSVAAQILKMKFGTLKDYADKNNIEFRKDRRKESVPKKLKPLSSQDQKILGWLKADVTMHQKIDDGYGAESKLINAKYRLSRFECRKRDEGYAV
jgi:hypothetical protein